jgi:hypothetical protein
MQHVSAGNFSRGMSVHKLLCMLFRVHSQILMLLFLGIANGNLQRESVYRYIFSRIGNCQAVASR